MDILSQDIMYLPGVGPHRKEILGKELVFIPIEIC